MRECRRCQGTGWITTERWGELGVRPCSCRQERLLRYRMEQARIPPRFFDADFDTFQPLDETQAEALDIAIRFAESYPEVESGLFFVGPTGVGKTHLMVAVLKALLGRNVPVLFCDCNELLTQLRRSYSREVQWTETDLVQPLLEVEVLLLDDLGAHRASEWVFDVLFSIINHRYNHRKCLLVTSNLFPSRPGEDFRQALMAHLSQRVYSRLAEMCLITVMRGPDYRTDIRQPTWQQTRGTGEGLLASRRRPTPVKGASPSLQRPPMLDDESSKEPD